MATKKTTIQDVARKAGVSITTVSRFLNQRFEAMSEETKARIESVIGDLNYQPNMFAQGLKGNKTRTIGVLVVNMSYPFCVSIIRSISDLLTQNEYGLLVAESGGDAHRERKQLQSLMAQKIDGLIIQTGGDNRQLLEQIAQEIPVVLVDRMFDIPGTTNIVTNNQSASLALVKRVLEQGYHSTVYVTEPTDGISTREERLTGYELACHAFGIPPTVVHVRRDDPRTFDGLWSLLRQCAHKPPFAVYTANGLIALGVFPHVQSQWKIPSELGFATFDEPDWSVLVRPGLTCIRQPTEQMGQLAAQTILTKLQRDEATTSDHVIHVVDSDVIWKDSTNLA